MGRPGGWLRRTGDSMTAPQISSDRSLHGGLSHLAALQAESIFIMREVAAEFERPVVLFSGGKDSIILLRIAEKAFRPQKFPFPVMHVDTGHNFPEALAFRDRRVADPGERPVGAPVPDTPPH